MSDKIKIHSKSLEHKKIKKELDLGKKNLLLLNNLMNIKERNKARSTKEMQFTQNDFTKSLFLRKYFKQIREIHRENKNILTRIRDV